jgi:hypothetical protein
MFIEFNNLLCVLQEETALESPLLPGLPEGGVAASRFAVILSVPTVFEAGMCS